MGTRDFQERFFPEGDFIPWTGTFLPAFPDPNQLREALPGTQNLGNQMGKWAFLSWIDFALEHPDEVWERDWFGQSRYFYYLCYLEEDGEVPAFAVEVVHSDDFTETYDYSLIIRQEDLAEIRSGALVYSRREEWAREVLVRRLNEMALDKYDQNRLDDARAYINRAIEASGATHAYLFNNRGLISWKMGETEDAKRDFLESIRLDSVNGDSHFNMGLIFFDEARYHDALRYLGRAAEINPSDSQYLTELGHVYLELDREKDALEFFQKAFENNPNDAQVDFHLGYYFLYKKNEPHTAARHFHKGLEKDPDDEFAMADLAVAYLATGDKARASLLRKILEQQPQPMPYTISRLVFLSVEMGDYETALEYYSRALELQDPFEPEWLHYHAALIYAKTNRPKEAVDLLKVAVKLGGEAVIERAITDKGWGALRGIPAFEKLIRSSGKRTGR